MASPVLTGREISFPENSIIVSKTDTRGIITYANDVFLQVAGYHEHEVLGHPHNLIRHPHMPRCVFALLWETIASGREIFAYVLNLTKSGDGYWVFAHVTPSHDLAGRHVGYHSNRRVPDAEALNKIRPLYARLLETERRAPGPREGLAASRRLLDQTLADAGLDYSRFVFGLSFRTRLENAVA